MVKLNSVTKEKLIDLYTVEKKSLGDIGMIYGVSRTAIYKKLKNYGIEQRSKSEARIEAQKQGKYPSKRPKMEYIMELDTATKTVLKSLVFYTKIPKMGCFWSVNISGF